MFRQILLIVLILIGASTGQAVPPRELTLDYDQEAQVLKIQMSHTSRNLDKHYIRKITVKRNDDVAESFVYRRQIKPSEVSVDLDISAEPGDSLYVIAYCNKGGVAEATVQLPELEKPKSRLRRIIPRPLTEIPKAINDAW